MVPSITNVSEEPFVTRLTFNQEDTIIPIKSETEDTRLESLEKMSISKLGMGDSDDEMDRIQIHTDDIDLSGFDILDELDKEKKEDSISLDFEEL